MGEIEVMHPDEEGWSEWVHPLPGYLMQCCDCGLIHEMETAIVKAHEAITPTADGEDSDHIIVFRMRRPNNTLHPNHSETAQERPASPASGAE